ncbi:hypothetical protein LIER_19724 [Lithospermum erythrorhizon]|uniref:Uncharacterized protein n=1 Tax=Lithospermum erythrorhizon TaxID=34254 RepID=A0AAV3QL39_LITER
MKEKVVFLVQLGSEDGWLGMTREDNGLGVGRRVVEKLIVKFYKNLFTSKGPLREEHKDVIRRNVSARVPEEYWS